MCVRACVCVSVRGEPAARWHMWACMPARRGSSCTNCKKCMHALVRKCTCNAQNLVCTLVHALHQPLFPNVTANMCHEDRVSFACKHSDPQIQLTRLTIGHPFWDSLQSIYLATITSPHLIPQAHPPHSWLAVPALAYTVTSATPGSPS